MAHAFQQDPTLLCVMCKKDGEMACNGCHAIRYCSKECQKQDWRLHKLLCKAPDQHRSPRKPDMKRGIYFACDRSAPVFVWYNASFHNQGRLEIRGDTFPHRLDGMKTGAKMWNNPIESFNRPLFKNEGTIKGINMDMEFTQGPGDRKRCGAPNNSFTKINEELVERQKGHIFAYGLNSTTRSFFSLDMENLRHIVDYLRKARDAEMRYREMSPSETAVRAIFSMGIGEGLVFKSGEEELCYSEVKIDMPAKDEDEWDCLSAAKIGIPVVIRKARPGLSWRGRKFNDEHADWNPSYSLIIGKANSPNEYLNFRLAYGSYYIVRQNGKPLDSLCFHAMFKYFMDTHHTYTEACKRNGTQMDMGVFVSSLSRERFMVVYKGLVREYEAKHATAYPQPSPYDV